MSSKRDLLCVLVGEAEAHRALAEAINEAAAKLAFCPEWVVPEEPLAMRDKLSAIRCNLRLNDWQDPFDAIVANDAAEALDKLERVG
jgi:hypothetical protein